ncbi:Ribosomal protein S18 acetylase RimI [Micromonospora nigra]|uniref:Ribosomal protein S18 acetylase RimI n=1 Tax=Micromonospora nigra TaxID=145857 RepID=A0A1C6RAT3_9ACTN|nr:GNAT family N-acetyltransferase [Micromonospora nigra]SCL14254.1 Ribosomal protein S18 acetylase RimI [Micromonospora nigra]
MDGHHSIRVRLASLADLAEIVAVHVAARTAYYRAGGLTGTEIDNPADQLRRHEGWQEAIRAPEKRVICAELDGRIVGVAAMGPPLDDAGFLDDAGPTGVGQLYQIHVHPECWGRGVGGHLHADFVDYLRSEAMMTGRLEAWERNTRGHSFYLRHGWQPDGHRRPGPDGTDYLRMRLDLSPADGSVARAG